MNLIRVLFVFYSCFIMMMNLYPLPPLLSENNDGNEPNHNRNESINQSNHESINNRNESIHESINEPINNQNESNHESINQQNEPCNSHIFKSVLHIMDQIFTIYNETEIIYFYGPALEKLIINKSLEGYHPLMCMIEDTSKIDGIIETMNALLIRKYRMYSIEDINSGNFSNDKPNYWHVNVTIKNQGNLNWYVLPLIFHTVHVKKTLFDCDNLMLNKNGFCIYDLGIDMGETKFPGTLILQSLRNISKNECNMISIENLHIMRENTHDLFNIINEQNLLIQRGKKIIRGIANVLENDELCSICYNRNDVQLDTYLYILECRHIFCSNCIEKHMCSFALTHCQDCPICRQKIVFKIQN